LVVVNVIDMPIKGPVAPLEFCFLANRYFTAARDPLPRSPSPSAEACSSR